jgi:hypothetical protein
VSIAGGSSSPLDAALDRLAARDTVACEIALLRFFAGLRLADIASSMGLDEASITDRWAFARAFIHRETSRTRQEDRSDE